MDKTPRLNIKISENIDKAIKYAKIETGKTRETMVEEALHEYLLKLGFLKEDGEVDKPVIPSVVKQEDGFTEA